MRPVEVNYICSFRLFKLMNEFLVYLRIGFEHILDLKGYDHILFIIALCSTQYYRNWKQILILVTGFTIGHSLTLLLSVLNIIAIDADLIELLIPVTILMTAAGNVLLKTETRAGSYVRYAAAIFFGLIHGLGFSNYLKSLLSGSEIIFRLLSFNLGIELGQLIVVFAIFLLNFIFVGLLRSDKRSWTLFLSGAVFGITVILLIQRFTS
jgi:hypothetical protein